MKQSSVVSDQSSAGPTTTQVYRPIVEHGDAHLLAMANLVQAVARGDEVEMKKFFDQVIYFEQAQRQAGIEARQYFLSKVQR